MVSTRAKIRLYVDTPLDGAQSVLLERDQAQYLFSVMRLKPGDHVAVFNGRDGEWLCQVAEAAKRHGVLKCLKQSAPQSSPPDLWLLFSPIKKARTDFIVEKAVEMGAARVLPVQTRYTNSERFRQDRLQAHAVEAAEQCAATYVPDVDALQKLEHVLANWPQNRRIMFCDESLAGAKAALTAAPLSDEWAILVGPEGGFSPEEQAMLRSLPFVTPVSLGPRILRADTAAVAALTLWQSELGDWA
jgi:16S rRNA (uracil1498-N3)-methyltransferase